MRKVAGWFLMFALVLALVVPAIAGAGSEDLFDGLYPSQKNDFTIEQDKELSQQMVSMEIEAPVLVNYLQGLIDKLVAHAPEYAKKFAYRPVITLALDKEMRSLPGGAVVVPISALAELDSEDRLVASLAHEIGHSALRHGTAIMTLEKNGADDNAIVRFYVEKETEADLFGARLLMATGYSPLDVIKFFDDRVTEGKPHDEKHPAHAARAKMYRAEMERLAGKFPECQKTPAGEIEKIRKIAGKIIIDSITIFPRTPGDR